MSPAAQRDSADLDARLEALNDAVTVASGRLPEGELALTRNVIARSGQRLGLGVGYTVAALAGGTGSGKSSLFNSLSGRELSVAGARRPTTGVTHACVWGEASPDALLDWLAVPRRHHHQTTSQDGLDGLVLLDLPDSDSTELAHRVEVDRLVQIVDLLVWVLDPQKYADAVMHDRYLRPLATHASVMLLVLNQIDRLDRGGRDTCLADIKRLARADGLGNVRIIPTSSTTGEGVEQLKSELAQRVDARRTATERLAADVARAVGRLQGFCDSKKEPRDVKGAQRGALVDALADAGGVERVTNAVAQAHVHRAILATGSPFTRWLRRLRPDPLRRLHLSPGLDTSTRTSLPTATPVQRAQVGTALRRLSDNAGGDLPAPWPACVKARATAEEERLPDDLDRVVAAADLGDMQAPRWWRVLGALQTALAATAIAGALWLTVLFFFDWMKFPSLPLPRVDRLPVPTLLLVGGLLAGVIVAFIGRQLAAAGGRRRKRAARQRLRSGIEQVADERIVTPMNDELEAYRKFCTALQRARAGRRRLGRG
jgi:GTP-binding protein EngB required for normal cell division